MSITLARDDLSDLQLPPEEAEREREFERRRNGHGGHGSGSNGNGLRTCTCEHPMPGGDDDGSESCFRCGHWITPPSPRALSVVRPAEEPAEGDVPWSARDERELRQLVKARRDAPFLLGDKLLECVPQGRTHANNGAFKPLEELAARVGLKASTARRYRSVSHAWPKQHRVDGIPYGVFVTYTRGGRRAAHYRASVLRRLAADGPVTADRVRQRLGHKRDPRRARDPLRNVVNRIERASGYLAGELETLEPSPFLARERLLAAAQKAQAIGEALEIAAEGADRSRLAAVRPRLI